MHGLPAGSKSPDTLIDYPTGWNKNGDVSGAFGPQSEHFRACHNQDPKNLFVLDNGKGDMGDHWTPCGTALLGHLNAFTAKKTIDAVAIFCHGDQAWIQFGFGTDSTSNLAAAIAKNCS